MSKTGVLLTAFGAPRGLEDLDAFLLAVSGAAPTADTLSVERRKLLTIGGGSPLHAGAERVAAQLERRLSGLPAAVATPGEDDGLGFGLPGADAIVSRSLRTLGEVVAPVEVGMLYGNPSMAEAARTLKERGAERIVHVRLSPFGSAMSDEGWLEAVAGAVEGAGVEWSDAPGWGTTDGFVALAADACIAAREELPGEARTLVVFVVPSPAGARTGGGPVRTDAEDAAARVAALCGLGPVTVGGAGLAGIAGVGGSAGKSPWLITLSGEADGAEGELLGIIDAAAAGAFAAVEVCPMGWIVADAWTAYDLDVIAAERAFGLDMDFGRSRVPGEEPAMIEVLERAVRQSA